MSDIMCGGEGVVAARGNENYLTLGGSAGSETRTKATNKTELMRGNYLLQFTLCISEPNYLQLSNYVSMAYLFTQAISSGFCYIIGILTSINGLFCPCRYLTNLLALSSAARAQLLESQTLKYTQSVPFSVIIHTDQRS